MKKFKIKICGITRKEDAILAESLGAWAIGFIFVKNTPRYILPEKAAEIVNALSENTEKVGVFMNLPIEEVIAHSNLAGITKIQLHGSETPEYCEFLAKLTNKELIKAISIKDSRDIKKIDGYKGKVSYILLDSISENQTGGTGKTFDWELAKIASNKKMPIILAGGLNPDNIKQAHETVQPYALDVSSGVESEKGIKDKDKLVNIINKCIY